MMRYFILLKPKGAGTVAEIVMTYYLDFARVGGFHMQGI